MEVEVVKTLASSSNVIILFLLASGPLFGAGILFIAYKLAHKFGERFINGVNDIAEQTKLMREMLYNIRQDVDELKDEVDEVKNITTDNNKRLDDIEDKLDK